MPKYAAKVDANQGIIKAFFRAAGWEVVDMSRAGGGVPDIDISRGLINIKVEIKDGKRGRLNERQVKWHQEWAGAVVIIRSIEDAQRLNDNYLDVAEELEYFMLAVLDGMEVV